MEGEAEEVGDPLHTWDLLCAISPLACVAPLFLPPLWMSILDLFSETFQRHLCPEAFTQGDWLLEVSALVSY